MKLGVLPFSLMQITNVNAHGMMDWPVPRQNRHAISIANGGEGCAGQACGWFSEGCAIGCACFGTTNGMQVPSTFYNTPGMMNCSNPIEPTIPSDSRLRTFNMELKSPKGDWSQYMPWRAPGSATPLDPCGVVTDGLSDTPEWWPNWLDNLNDWWENKHHIGGRVKGHRYGDKGTDIPEPQNVARTLWVAGGRAIVSHSLAVNHGGGYQYRLCPKTKSPTEDCFRALPLAFARNTSTIHWEPTLMKRADVVIPAIDVTDGVVPVGSTWRRNPIPACNCDANDACGEKGPDGKVPPQYVVYNKNQTGPGECSTGLQFEPACEGCFGWSVFNFSTVDELIVPSEPGEYMLSWRWDCEQSAQVWNSCADITIVAAEELAV